MAKKAIRGAKMPRATGHSIGGMGRPRKNNAKPAARGAHAIPGKAVAKAKV